jgi:hypothetical protein
MLWGASLLEDGSEAVALALKVWQRWGYRGVFSFERDR